MNPQNENSKLYLMAIDMIDTACGIKDLTLLDWSLPLGFKPSSTS